MKKITYIYSKNRKYNYVNNSIQAKEFYYGLTRFDDNEFEIDIIEFEINKSIFSRLLHYFDRVMNKFISLPFYTSKLVSFKNLKKMFKTDELFLVNGSVGCSALPLLIFLKLFSKVNVSIFVMGLYSKQVRYKKFERIHIYTIKALIYFVDNVIFLGKAEMERAVVIHRKKLKKFKFLPFPVDTDFWRQEERIKIDDRKTIIFVGNDSKRDYQFLINLATNMQDYNFTVVSSNSSLLNLDLPNVKILKGFWGGEYLSDLELKELYSKARLSIIPLKESYQPSGQSVAQQSMSVGVPVLITKTRGFWNKEDFKDSFNIFFMKDNNIENWTAKISTIYSDHTLLKEVTKNAKKTITNNYDLDSFYNELLNLTR